MLLLGAYGTFLPSNSYNPTHSLSACKAVLEMQTRLINDQLINDAKVLKVLRVFLKITSKTKDFVSRPTPRPRLCPRGQRC